jgi:type II secretory pathway predicted ATPase ExeA
MYLEYFGLCEPPFRITPHIDFFYSGAKRGATLEALIYAVTQCEGIVKVSGEVGSGKTMLCRMLLERLPQDALTVLLANPTLSRDEIVYAIADELQIDLPEARPNAMMHALQDRLISLYAEGRRVVLLIDEAHAMPAETLEQIRLLSNLESSRNKLMQIVLFGQPELNDLLNRPQMRQLKDRVTHHFVLEPLAPKDVAAYLAFRMRAAGYAGPDVFEPSAVRLLARASQGLTRRVNVLADKSLLAAYAQDTHQVRSNHVRAAIKDSEIPRPALRRSWPWLGAAALGLGGIAAALWWFWPVSGTQASAGTQSPTASPSQVPAPATTPETPTAAARSDSGSQGPLQPEVLEATRRWLETSAGERWILLLLSAETRDQQFLKAFVRRNANLVDPGQLRAYRATVGGTERIYLIYGDYATQAEARAVLAQLSPSLRAYSPYPRQIKHLR